MRTHLATLPANTFAVTGAIWPNPCNTPLHTIPRYTKGAATDSGRTSGAM